MTAAYCGLWLGRRSLVAAVVDEQGRPAVNVPVGHGDDAWWGLLEHLEATVCLDYELVLPDWLAKEDRRVPIALRRGIPVWLAPRGLVDAVRIVGRMTTGPPARTAAAVARLPLAAGLRGHLRRLLPPDQRQLQLL